MSLDLLIIKSLYFFLPAYFANMAPEFFKWVPFNTPIWEKKLGKNKTWRGLIVAVLVGILTFWLQKYLFQFNFFYNISIIDYADFGLMLGFLLGLGAILGDAVESYLKRKYEFKPGESWKPWDQLDFVLGALMLSFIVYMPPMEFVFVLLIISPILHIIISRIGYWLKIKKTKF